MGKSSSSSASTTTNNNTTNTLQGLYGANVAGDDVWNNQDYNQDYSVTNVALDGGVFDFASDASGRLSDVAQDAIYASMDTAAGAYDVSKYAMSSIEASGAQFSDALAYQNESALNFAGDTVTTTLNANNSILDKALSLASGAGDMVSNALERTAEQSAGALSFASNASKADGGQSENIIKYAMGAAVLMAIAVSFGGKKR